ncbi:DUF4340 domain-containing protein [Rubinisphaera margarita]|uniref:DUF4340 domain-containing protein n=1 Tax=Rubinisphaera margarita TaxID=2909586 RepID=UPI001EE9A184|nr:DUF4340 domain-containing protein [Rubinisphaera margarita]MCG6156183.1 DUF4340 domain-containing protein [Rubinisphaera margarita]
MDNKTRTGIYVVAAVVCLGLAVWDGMQTQEMNRQDAAKIGEPFFADFNDPTEATGIRVITYNNDTAEIKPFEVKFANNEWRIPSHYNYPADGKDQLVKTAGSLAGVERGAVAGESELDFARLGVVDPLADGADSLKGRGDRLTLTKGDKTLVDLIIGNEVEGQSGSYYVRKPDEKITYITKLDIDLSTQFGEWIEPDLLQIERNKLREILIKDYSVDETSQRIVFNDILELTRSDSSDPWKLAELNEETEQVKTATVNTVVSTLDDLKIVGVRPKPQGLSSDLKISGSVSGDTRTMIDLQSKGYYIVPTQDGGAELFSNEGDLAAVTEEGVVYVLRFGEVFTGDEFDIEVGSASQGEAASADAEAAGSDAESDDLKKSRYLFITVQFDPTVLGAAPEKPTAPPEDAEAAAEGEQTPQQKYEAELKQYEEDLAAYNEKLEAGQKRVQELNQRFADWYYVIDAASFDKLDKSREDLVEPKTPGEADATTQPPAMTPPVISTPEATSTPAGTTTPPAVSTPEGTSKPAGTSTKPAPATTGAAPEMTSTPEPATSPTPPSGTSTPAPAGTTTSSPAGTSE